ncbi:MAG: hypothetical protein ACT4OO_03500 [Nitrospiraceae bacterium]
MAPDHSADDYFCVATVLPLRQWTHVFRFLSLIRQIRKQLAGSHGLITYRVRARVLRKRFWTLSVWANKSAAQTFVRSGAHERAITPFQEWMAPGAAFVEWYRPKKRVRWSEAFVRLKHPSFTYDAE